MYTVCPEARRAEEVLDEVNKNFAELRATHHQTRAALEQLDQNRQHAEDVTSALQAERDALSASVNALHATLAGMLPPSFTSSCHRGLTLLCRKFPGGHASLGE